MERFAGQYLQHCGTTGPPLTGQPPARRRLFCFQNNGATAPGGLWYLATRNDNGLSSPPITGNSISLAGSDSMTFVGKPGGANYYVTSMSMKGNSTVSFDNTAGPITIWQSTADGSLTISGGVAAVKMSTDPTKAVRIYAAATGGITLNGNSELDAGVYNVTDGLATTTMNGTGTIYGTIICDNFVINGNNTISATLGYFTAPRVRHIQVQQRIYRGKRPMNTQKSLTTLGVDPERFLTYNIAS